MERCLKLFAVVTFLFSTAFAAAPQSGTTQTVYGPEKLRAAFLITKTYDRTFKNARVQKGTLVIKNGTGESFQKETCRQKKFY